MADVITLFQGTDGNTRANMNAKFVQANAEFANQATQISELGTGKAEGDDLGNAINANKLGGHGPDYYIARITPVTARNIALIGADGSLVDSKSVFPDQNLGIYVNGASGSDTTGHGSSASPYKTINKAISSIPKLLNGNNAIIYIAAGTYAENINFKGIIGGKIQLVPAGNIAIGYLKIEDGAHVISSSAVTITCDYIHLTNGGKLGLLSGSATTLNVVSRFDLGSITNVSICAETDSNLYLNCNVSVQNNTGRCVLATALSQAYLYNLSGSGNTGVGIQVISGAVVKFESGSFSTATAYQTANGSKIYTGNQSSVPNY